jgi:hypothetical protein
MAKGVDYTFVGYYAVGERELTAGFEKRAGH